MTSDDCSYTRKDIVLMTLFVLVGLGIRLYFLQFYDVISADGISYVNIAKDFISGRGLAAATHYPPFYPILVGLASTLCHDFETAGLAVSVVMGCLLVVPVYLLGAEFFGKRVGVAAAVLSITWPTLRYWSTAVMSQATYITLLLFGVYFLWQAYKKSSLLFSVLAGVFFACAHLTRSEGVLVLFVEIVVLVLFTFINRLPLKKLFCVLTCLGVFLIVCSPYLALLHESTGKWQLTGKSKSTIADSLSEYLGKPDLKHDPSFKEIGYLDLFRVYPDFIRTNYLKNIKKCWDDMLPLYGWILAAVGFIAGGMGREKLCERAYLLATFAPLSVIIIFFFIGPEYTQPYLPVLFLCIGHGLFTIENWVVKWFWIGKVGFIARYGWCVPVILILLYGAWNVVSQVPADRNQPYEYTKDEGRFDEKRIGIKLSKTLPEGAILMTRSGRIGFYSGHPYVFPPQVSYGEIINFARKNKIDYLIATIQVLNMRPQLEFLYGPILDPGRKFTPPPELELVTVDQQPGGLPYIVYRFAFR
jgi:4-amino-4-deoxy-L-arabinose transferase-like glycosyltransferase